MKDWIVYVPTSTLLGVVSWTYRAWATTAEDAAGAILKVSAAMSGYDHERIVPGMKWNARENTGDEMPLSKAS